MPAALVLAALLTGQAGTTAPGPASAVAEGERFAVYLVSFGPGRHIWERFGHNAIWIRDTTTGANTAFDYGRFSFETSRFFLRFAQGRMEYWMGREDGVALINAYIARGRAIWLQELALDPEDRVRLRDVLEADFADDQGRYRYNYYRDNCSTRLRDAIDLVVGGAIRTTLDTAATGTTFRFHTRRSLEHNALSYFAVTAALGPATDRPITRFDETFLPLRLRDHLRDVVVVGSDGRPRRLVRAEVLVAESDRFSVPDTPSNWTWRFLLAGVALGGMFTGLGRAGARSPWARRVWVTLAALWALVTALGGGMLAFFWALSEHSDTWRNANLWQFNLLAGVLFVLLAGAARGNTTRLLQARRIAVIIAGLGALGLVLKGLPGTGQANLDVIGFMLPAHLGLAAGLSALSRPLGRAEGPPGPP